MKSQGFRSFYVIPLTLLLGCGGGSTDRPDLGTVTGVVKLDGEPLPAANVEFRPEEGRPSNGKTNEEGEYELDYTINAKGAKVGEHTVKIWTFNEGEDSEAGELEGKAEEKVPVVYNEETTLTETVEPGSQVIDFDLDSSAGEVVQPGQRRPVSDDGC